MYIYLKFASFLHTEMAQIEKPLFTEGKEMHNYLQHGRNVLVTKGARASAAMILM